MVAIDQAVDDWHHLQEVEANESFPRAQLSIESDSNKPGWAWPAPQEV